MYARKGILKSMDPSDRNRLKNFAQELGTHSMYQAVIDDMMSAPGFVRKENQFIHERAGELLITSVMFTDKDAFDQYISSETSEGIWVYIEVMAQQNGIEMTVIDSYI